MPSVNPAAVLGWIVRRLPFTPNLVDILDSDLFEFFSPQGLTVFDDFITHMVLLTREMATYFPSASSAMSGSLARSASMSCTETPYLTHFARLLSAQSDPTPDQSLSEYVRLRT
jgi:hypothetical protein